MSKKSIFLFISILIIAFATGCKCSPSEIAVFEILLDSPPDGSIISSLTPTFNWHDNEGCEPDTFYLSAKINGEWGDYWNPIPGTGSSYALSSPLLPGREYVWSMLPQISGEPSGPESERSYFLTGPVCSGETLVAPELTEPDDNGWISHHKPQEFAWTYPGGCLPESFTYEFAADPGFATILKTGTTSSHVQHIFDTFPNCSTIFWRVAAMDGTSVGPWSDVHDFHWVTDDTCWQLHWPSLNSGLIQGRIWFDDCPLTNWLIPLDPNFNLNPLCTITGGIGIHGNGVYESEQFIDDVRVDLGAGPCPSTGLDHYIAAYSYYEFTVLTPGTYCVSINKQQTVTDVDLPYGLWTEPLTEDPVTEVTIAFSGGLQTVKQDFGWDDREQFFVYFELEETTNCRVGPFPDCIPAEIPKKGELIHLLAQDENSDWKMAAINGKECYLYLQTTLNLPPYEPPGPCPTPIPTPRPKPSGGVNCSNFTDPTPCREAGCTWYPSAASKGYCAE